MSWIGIRARVDPVIEDVEIELQYAQPVTRLGGQDESRSRARGSGRFADFVSKVSPVP
jgi:hypothetical protein